MAVEDVANAKAKLLAAGENLDGKCGAHKIPAQTAWDMRSNGQGWGLVHSTGSGCTMHEGTPQEDIYRADSLMQRDGTTKDILLYAESKDGAVFPEVSQDDYNIPAWNETGPQDPANWREPYDPGLVPDEGGGTPPPAPADTQAILDAITASETNINAHTTEEADRVIQRMEEMRSEVIDFAEILGKAIVAIAIWRRRPEGQPPPVTVDESGSEPPPPPPPTC